MIKPNESALLLIDIQKGLDDWAYYGGNRNNTDAEVNASRILNWYRVRKLPVFHVQHSSTNPNSPLHPSKPGFEIKDEVRPNAKEPVITKHVNSAFIGTDLEYQLRQKNIKTVVIVGLTTNHCISSTVRMAANFGFRTFLISDATAAFDGKGPNGKRYHAETMHQTSLASLHDEFAQVLTTNEIIGDASVWG